MKANDPNKAGLGKVNYLELGPVKYLTIAIKVERTVPLAFITAMGLLKRLDYEIYLLLPMENKPKYKASLFECLWQLKSPQADPENKDNWVWKWMIIQPETTTEDRLLEAQKALTVKRPQEKERWMLPKLETINMGKCAQTGHKGSIDHKDKTIRFLKSEIEAREYEFLPNLMHQEVYINNPLNAKPEKQRAVIRFPIRAIPNRKGMPLMFTPATLPAAPHQPVPRVPKPPPVRQPDETDEFIIQALILQLNETQGWNAQKIADFLRQPLDKTQEVLNTRWSK